MDADGYADVTVNTTMRRMNDYTTHLTGARPGKFGVSVGDRIRLLSMGDDPRPIAPGTVGTVVHICTASGFEQIGVRWENGRSLAVIPGIDRWYRVEA